MPVSEVFLRGPALTPLFRMAVLKGTESSILHHLGRGISIEARDDRGRTALMLAAAAGRMEICQLLVEQGANVASIDAAGHTAADLAAVAGHQDIASVLLPVDLAPASHTITIVAAKDDDCHDDTGWLPEADIRIEPSDTALADNVITLQAAIASHRSVQEADAWALAELIIAPHSGTTRTRVGIPDGSEKFFTTALEQGWVTEKCIRKYLGRSPVEVRKAALSALELGGVRIENGEEWIKAASVAHTGRRSRSRQSEVDDVLHLFEVLVAGSIDPVDVYAGAIDGFVAPSREEEVRLFQGLAEAGRKLIAVVNRHRMELQYWLEQQTRSTSGEECEETATDDGEENDRSIVSEPDELNALFLHLETSLASSDHSVPYAALVRLLEAASCGQRNGDVGQRLARALERFRHARDRLATTNLKIVPWIARRYSRRTVSMMDLVQEGNIGLLRAIEKFDSSRGSRFITYAAWWVRQSITRAIDDQEHTVRIPVHGREALRKIERYRARQQALTGVAASRREVSEELELPPDLIRKLDEAPVDRVEWTAVVDGSDFMPAMNPQSFLHPEYAASSRELRNNLFRALRTLSPREERVLRMRFGLVTDRDHSLEEVGDYFGVTRERIRQIEAKALKKLTFKSRSQGLGTFLGS